MKWPFRLAAFALVVALLAGAIVALRPPAIDVDVERASLAPLEEDVVEDGKARIREKYTVSAPVTGTLARIDLREGDVVEPGAVVARLLPLASPLLDPESRKSAEQRLASAIDAALQAKATRSRAQALSDSAKSDLTRASNLASRGAIPQSQLDQSTVDARAREAELVSAGFAERVTQHEIAQARAALARFTPGASQSEQFEVTSPVRGRVLHVLHKSEGVVAAGAGLLELGDPAALELVADVLSQDAVDITPGMPARIVHWGGPATLRARVRSIEPAAFTKTSALGVDEQRVNVVLDPDSPPDDWRSLGDGFAVQVEITVWSKPEVLQVPTSALFRDGAGWSVFVVEQGHARVRHVEAGHRGPLATEILGGVRADERLVIHPGASVRDGVRVAFR